MHYDTSLYSAGCKRKIAVDEAVFWSTIGPHLCIHVVQLQLVTQSAEELGKSINPGEK